jgi:hypothetical protein
MRFVEFTKLTGCRIYPYEQRALVWVEREEGAVIASNIENYIPIAQRDSSE